MEEDFLKIKELNQQLDQVIQKSYEEVNQVYLKVQKQEEPKKEETKETILDTDLLKRSIEKSVRPNVFVSDKRKKVKINFKKAAFITAATTILMTSVSAYTINHYYPNQQYKENLKEYKEEIYMPNMTYVGVKENASAKKVPVHDHDWESMIQEIKEKYENPITAFYMFYYTLDEYCQKNNLNLVLNEINLYYGTDYHSIEDIYASIGVDSFKGLKEYVKMDLSRLKEGELSDGENRSSNLGR